METIHENSTVTVHYTGKFEDNTVFDSSLNNEPIQVTLGQGMLISGFEKGLIGMAKGDTKTIEISFEEAYGPVYDDRIQEVERQYVPEEVQVGQTLSADTPQGPINVVVTEVKESTVVLDGNHPLAGKNLIFDLVVVDFN
jgi:FKBP-type peptidyl-prolyl cis-trans isomerase SlpA